MQSRVIGGHDGIHILPIVADHVDSAGNGERPRFLFFSNRGLHSGRISPSKRAGAREREHEGEGCRSALHYQPPSATAIATNARPSSTNAVPARIRFVP